MEEYELNVIYKTLAGSQLYGTALPSSDTDYRGVCLQPYRSLIGTQGFEFLEHKAPDDLVIYGIKKFLMLSFECNPNIIELWFAPTSGPTLVKMTELWEKVLALRPAVLTSRAEKSFVGYAISQQKRMQTHFDWLHGKEPPDVKPEDFGGEQRPEGGMKWPNAVAQQLYSNARHQREQYERWMAERNPIRHELEVKYGYDTKYGMHTIRLIDEGLELLTDGKITLPRPDAKRLVEIRNGSMTFEQIMTYFEEGQAKLAKAKLETKLPKDPDLNILEDLLIYLNMESIADAERNLISHTNRLANYLRG